MESSPANILAESCKKATSSLASAMQALFQSRVNLEAQSDAPAPSGWNEDESLLVIVGGASNGFLLTISNCPGFVPEWFKSPDNEGKRKLKEFGAQCASMLQMGDPKRELLGVAFVGNVRTHMEEIEDVEEILRFRFEVSNDQNQTEMFVYWPIAAAESFVDESFITPKDRGEIEEIPAYGRSLLKVQVPLRVALANSRMPVEKVLEIGPGSIIQFEKRYDQPLLMEIDRRPIAVGNAVKVGDKFGFRVGSICKPRERFFAVQGKVSGPPIGSEDVESTIHHSNSPSEAKNPPAQP